MNQLLLFSILGQTSQTSLIIVLTLSGMGYLFLHFAAMLAADKDKGTLNDSVQYASKLVSRTEGLLAVVNVVLSCQAFVERKKDRYLTQVIPDFFFGDIVGRTHFGVYEVETLSNLKNLAAKLESRSGAKDFLAALSYRHLLALNQNGYTQAINEVRSGHSNFSHPEKAARKAYDCITTLTDILGNCCPQDLITLKEDAIQQTNTAYYLLFVEEWVSGKRDRNLLSLHELHALMVDGELRAQLMNKIIQMETGVLSEEEVKFAPELYTLKKAV